MRGHKLLSVSDDRKVTLKQVERRLKREDMSFSEFAFESMKFALTYWGLFMSFRQKERR